MAVYLINQESVFGFLLTSKEAVSLREIMELCCLEVKEFQFDKQQFDSLMYDQRRCGLHRLALNSIDHIFLINIEDIIYCQGNKGYTTFFLKNDRPIVASKVLKEYETVLLKQMFIRCHQSYLVNLGYIKKYFKEGYLELTDGTKIPVSTRKKNYVLKFIERI